jgi:hypothetical protein
VFSFIAILGADENPDTTENNCSAIYQSGIVFNPVTSITGNALLYKYISTAGNLRRLLANSTKPL